MSYRGKLASLVLGLFLSSVAFASEQADQAKSMMNAQDYQGAIALLSPYVDVQPTDAEARFLLALSFAQNKQTDSAINTFRKLTQDFPQLPEPHNNLAVLLAQKGDYNAARAALEAAISTHKSYATAHENLGDVYTLLATKSYNKVLELDTGNSVVQTKLNMLDRLNQATIAPPPVRPAPRPTPPVVAAVTPPAQPATPTRPAPRPATPRPVEPVTPSPVATRPAPQPPAAPAPATPRPAATTTAGGDVEPAALAAVRRWAAAWSAQDVNAYLAAYSARFNPGDGKTREEWAAQRRVRVTKPARIQVTVSNMAATRLSDTMVLVSFDQSYQASNYQDEVRKTLLLEQREGGWKIVRERTVATR